MVILNETIIEKAKLIKLVATDIDGVWTDGTMYYSPDGEIMKGFSTYDGMATRILMELGISVAVLTGENSPSVTQRIKKLGIKYYFPGEMNKIYQVKQLCTKLSISLDEVAYIGDDINDIDVLSNVGLSAMPSSSPIVELFKPDIITVRGGGQGAFRELADIIIKVQKSDN